MQVKRQPHKVAHITGWTHACTPPLCWWQGAEMCRQGHVCLHGSTSCLPGPLPSVSHLAFSLSVCLFESLSLFLSPSLQNLSPQFFCPSISLYLSPLGLSLFFTPSFTPLLSLSPSFILLSFSWPLPPSLTLSFLLCLSLSLSASLFLCLLLSLHSEDGKRFMRFDARTAQAAAAAALFHKRKVHGADTEMLGEWGSEEAF